MMNTRVGKVIQCMAALGGLLAISAAAPASDNAMDTCVQAFVAQAIPEGYPVRVVKRELNTRARKIQVTSKGAVTGESFGTATCVVGRDGRLLAMHVEGERIRVAKDSQRVHPAG